MTVRSMRLGLAAAAVLAAGACDAQVTSDYRGERMVEIRGNIVAETAPGAAEAALLWWSGAGGPPVTSGVTTEGAFPSAFTLSVYRRPPEAALIDVGAGGEADGPVLSVPWLPSGHLDCRVPAGADIAPGGGRLAIASVAAVGEGSGGVIGLAGGYALLFVASGTALAPGYHLMRVTAAASAASAGAIACHVCTDGGDTGAGACDGAALFLQLDECQDGVAGTQIEIRIRAG